MENEDVVGAAPTGDAPTTSRLINNLIAYKGASYIRDLMVTKLRSHWVCEEIMYSVNMSLWPYNLQWTEVEPIPVQCWPIGQCMVSELGLGWVSHGNILVSHWSEALGDSFMSSNVSNLYDEMQPMTLRHYSCKYTHICLYTWLHLMVSIKSSHCACRADIIYYSAQWLWKWRHTSADIFNFRSADIFRIINSHF